MPFPAGSPPPPSPADHALYILRAHQLRPGDWIFCSYMRGDFENKAQPKDADFITINVRDLNISPEWLQKGAMYVDAVFKGERPKERVITVVEHGRYRDSWVFQDMEQLVVLPASSPDELLLSTLAGSRVVLTSETHAIQKH